MSSSSSSSQSTPTYASGKKWFFEPQANKGVLVYRWLGTSAASKEWTRSNGESYGLVTAVLLPTEEALQKVRSQKSDASTEKYLQISGHNGGAFILCASSFYWACNEFSKIFQGHTSTAEAFLEIWEENTGIDTDGSFCCIEDASASVTVSVTRAVTPVKRSQPTTPLPTGAKKVKHCEQSQLDAVIELKKYGEPGKDTFLLPVKQCYEPPPCRSMRSLDDLFLKRLHCKK